MEFDNYSLNQQVVCRGQGVAEIVNIVDREILGESQQFYVLKLLNKDVKVMIPTTNHSSLRDLICEKEIPQVFTMLGDQDIEIQKSNWNKRYREYNHKLKNGSIYDIAEILRELNFTQNYKKLSFGERKIFEQAKELLVQEISVSSQTTEHEATERVDLCLQN